MLQQIDARSQKQLPQLFQVLIDLAIAATTGLPGLAGLVYAWSRGANTACWGVDSLAWAADALACKPPFSPASCLPRQQGIEYACKPGTR